MPSSTVGDDRYFELVISGLKKGAVLSDVIRISCFEESGKTVVKGISIDLNKKGEGRVEIVSSVANKSKGQTDESMARVFPNPVENSLKL